MVRNGGEVCWGEVKQTHTDGEQTNKKWEADKQAKGRKGGWGKDN